MKITWLVCSFSFAIVFPNVVFSEPQELLVPVGEDELEQVRVENDYFLKDYLYFAKRHRIVRVNEAALRSLDSLSISLFPDAKVIVQVEQFRDVPGTTVRWVGKVIDPDNKDFGFSFESDDQKTSVFGQQAKLNIGGVYFDKDIATNESFSPNTEWSIKGYPRPTDSSRIEKAAYLSINAFILSPAFDGVYKIQPLNATPEYHLVYEIDSTKEYAEEALVDPVLDAENLARREQHRLYMLSIGEGPGAVWAQNAEAAAAEVASRQREKK